MKSVIKTDKAPAPIGPYNQAILAGDFLFASGQIAINPETGDLVTGDIESETHQVMRNIKAILAEAGLDLSHVVKTTIFLADMNDFAKVNSVYGSYLSDKFPARETVQVSVLPKNVNIEISVTAYKG